MFYMGTFDELLCTTQPVSSGKILNRYKKIVHYLHIDSTLSPSSIIVYYLIFYYLFVCSVESQCSVESVTVNLQKS